MKNLELRLIFAGVFLFTAGSSVFALGRSAEEKKLEASAAELDKNHSEGQQRVADKICAEFGVSNGLVIGLRFRKMGDGEIAIALALAQGLHRIIKDEDLRRIVRLRQGPPVMGWGRVAGKLGLKLGPVISKVEKLSSKVRDQETSDKAEEAGKVKEEKEKAAEMAEKMKRPGTTVKEGMMSLSRQ
ncbi:MAG TPA: hypothetical protein DEQ38_13415 [Elusimicrobia bacterium]|nr:MAG: hypothetical protein A2089_05000 [Elusimicrobia bacterium GWD2_63_28]HCC49095.1 hypothetical protein [Elusimicrobiota bacterium]